MEILANFAFSDEELAELEEVWEPIFQVEVKRYEEFEAEILEPIILLIFFDISSGFLKAIGNEIWELIKRKILKIVAEKNGGRSDLEFKVKKGETIIRFKFATGNKKLMENALEKFPEALSYAEETEKEYLEFDDEKEEWGF